MDLVMDSQPELEAEKIGLMWDFVGMVVVK